MNDQQTKIDAIEELETAWSQAEMRADTGTLEAARVDRRWLLAGIHLSPIGGPPPFAPPGDPRAGEGTPPSGGSRR